MLYIYFKQNSTIFTSKQIYKSLKTALARAKKYGGIVKDIDGNILYSNI